MQQSHIAVIAISALCLFGLSSAQVQLQGACPSNIEVVPNFNVEKYLGTWYEYAKYPVSFEADGSCITAKYTLTQDGDVDVINTMKYKNKYTVNIVGYAKPVSNAKLMVTFPTSPVPNVSSNYWVLDTDYDNYSVVYSCEPDNDDSHSTTVWILTRAQQPSEDIINKAKAVLKENNISLQELVITNQNDCQAA